MADVDVLQRRVPVADAARHAVERQLGEATLLAVDDLDVLVALELLDASAGMSWAKSISPCCRAATIASELVKTRKTIRSMPLSRPYQFGFLTIVQSWPERHSVSEYGPGADAVERVVARRVVGRDGS